MTSGKARLRRSTAIASVIIGLLALVAVSAAAAVVASSGGSSDQPGPSLTPSFRSCPIDSRTRCLTEPEGSSISVQQHQIQAKICTLIWQNGVASSHPLRELRILRVLSLVTT